MKSATLPSLEELKAERVRVTAATAFVQLASEFLNYTGGSEPQSPGSPKSNKTNEITIMQNNRHRPGHRHLRQIAGTVRDVDREQQRGCWPNQPVG